MRSNPFGILGDEHLRQAKRSERKALRKPPEGDPLEVAANHNPVFFKRFTDAVQADDRKTGIYWLRRALGMRGQD